jgi:Trk K+ transport system NAD-binding subunit
LKLRGLSAEENEEEGDDGAHTDRNIIILGFHKVAAMLIAHMEHYSPHLLKKVHVIDSNQSIFPELKAKNVTCAYGDISAPDVLEHAHHGAADLVISTIPDSILSQKGLTNKRVLQVVKQVWEDADVIVTAESAAEASELYKVGADYVVRMAKLSAQRLEGLIIEHSSQLNHHHHLEGDQSLKHIFEKQMALDTKHQEGQEEQKHIHIKR